MRILYGEGARVWWWWIWRGIVADERLRERGRVSSAVGREDACAKIQQLICVRGVKSKECSCSNISGEAVKVTIRQSNRLSQI